MKPSDFRSARVIRGPHGSLFVQSVTMDGQTHKFSGALAGDKTLPELDTIVQQMRKAGFEVMGDLEAQKATLGVNTPPLMFRRQTLDPDAQALADMATPPAEPEKPTPADLPRRRISL